MKMISPAAAKLSLIHMTAISLFVGICSSSVLHGTQEQKVTELIFWRLEKRACG